MNLTDILDRLTALEQLVVDVTAVGTTSASLLPNLIEELDDYVMGQNVDTDRKVGEIESTIVGYLKVIHSTNDALLKLLTVVGTEPELVLDIEPNWQQIVAQFQSHLSVKGTWSNTYAGGIGQTISELVASSTMMLLDGIGVAQTECFPHLAKRQSSIYAGTEMLGVRISRKIPASVNVTLSRTLFDQIQFNHVQLVSEKYSVLDNGQPVTLVSKWVKVVYNGKVWVEGNGPGSYTLDGSNIVFDPTDIGKFFDITVDHLPNVLEVQKYSVFTVGGLSYFNRDLIVFEEGVETTTHTLYEGQPETYLDIASDYGIQTIRTGVLDFLVSDIDTEVYIEEGGTKIRWDKTQSLWNAGPEKVWLDRTTGYGEAHVIFGDGVYGAKPVGGALIYINYVRCSGSLANRNDIGLKVRGTTVYDLVGTTTSIISGGSDQKSSETYKAIGPDIFDSRYTVSRHKDYVANILNMGNVSDVVVKAQKDIAPNDVSWMNTMRVCVLPSTGDVMSDSEWSKMVEFLNENAHALVSFVRTDPVQLNIDIDLTIYVFNHIVIRDIRETIRKSIIRLFDRGPSTLGRTISISDLISAAKISGSVDWVELLINGDSRDIPMPDPYTYARLRDLNLSITFSKR